jgi:hypothetical protein
MSISAMKQALEALEKLWDIIDDIDTYGDMAKSDDKLYRSLVERRQRQRFEQTGISTDGYELNGGAITALRQAIAEAEKQEQKTPLKVLGLTVFTENRLRNGRVYDVETLQAMTNRDILAIPDMGKKALKEVLEALEVYAINISQERVDETAKREHDIVGACVTCGAPHDFWLSAPPTDFISPSVVKAISKREWVGLTEDEAIELLPVGDWEIESTLDFAKAIEAKLKEKNT